MLTRRGATGGAIAALSMPYFFVARTVKADQLTDGLVTSITTVMDNLSLRPAGQVGSDVPVAGGGTVFGRSTTAQANMMANDSFTRRNATNAYTANVSANPVGYTFARFQPDLRNFCCPMGVLTSQDIARGYAGAMTMLEGPNFVGLHVLTDLLKRRGHSSSEMLDWVWPLSPSEKSIRDRQRALITYQSIHHEDTSSGRVYADRDVLHARAGKCVLRYTHTNGEPDGGGEGALISDGRQEFRFKFEYDKAILRT